MRTSPILLFVSFIILICLSCQPDHQTSATLTDSEIKEIVHTVLSEMYKPENMAAHVDYNIGRYPNFYDLYSSDVSPDILFSEKYWVDFDAYLRPVGEYNIIQYQYIFILPSYSKEFFYLATDYFDPDREVPMTPALIFEIREYNSSDLVTFREALLRDTNPGIRNYRLLGGFSLSRNETDDVILTPLE